MVKSPRSDGLVLIKYVAASSKCFTQTVRPLSIGLLRRESPSHAFICKTKIAETVLIENDHVLMQFTSNASKILKNISTDEGSIQTHLKGTQKEKCYLLCTSKW